MNEVLLGDIVKLNPVWKGDLTLDDETVDFVPMSAVFADRSTAAATEYRNLKDVKQGYTSFSDGDVLLAKITPCFENGKIAQVRLKNRLGFGSTEFHVLRADPNKLDSRYLVHFLRRDQILVDGERKMTGSGGQRRVPKHFIESLLIRLPSLPEQRRIAAILDQADALRTKRREALAQLDSLTQSIFLEMFGDPITNPHQHPVSKLIDLVDRDRPISYGILMPGPNVADGISYVRVVDMKAGGIELSNIRKTTREISNSFRRSILKSGDLVMSIRGHVGRFAVVPKQLEGANITQDTARLAITGASSIYVREALRSIGFQRWMATHTKGVAVRGINLGDVKLMPIPVPSVKRQEEFENRATSIEKLIAAQRKALNALDALFASLQHRAFHGDL